MAKYKTIDDVKPNPVAYIQAMNAIKLGIPKANALALQKIPASDYDDNIDMVLKEYDAWIDRETKKGNL